MIEPTEVRDLDQEGVMGDINLSQGWSAGVQDAFFNARRDILIQGLVGRVERLEEVVADLLKKKQKEKEVDHGTA
jgi:hypothetical protein